MDFSLQQVVATGVISFAIALLLRYLEPKAKLAYWFPHEFVFNIKKENIILKTNSLTIQNLGTKPAESLEIIHQAEPDFFELYPSVNYEIQTSPNGNHVIKIPFLGAKEFVTLQLLSYKTIPQILSIRSKDSTASQIPITIQRIFPKWVNLLAQTLMVLGVVTIVVLFVHYFGALMPIKNSNLQNGELVDIEALQQRNARVEADKAWETSWTRRLVITAGIYLVAVIYFIFLGVNGALLHALVPAGGYFLSTLTLPFFKKLWLEKIYRKEM